ncbi:MAG: recombinase family protein [Rhodospirillales bacterium]
MNPTLRAVIYARYSTDLQSEASIEDQVEVCRRYAERHGWTVVKIYSDAAISGASAQRPGFQALQRDAGMRQFDTVICEAVDRLGRRLADTAGLQDTLAFHGVRLFTPQLGEVTTIHVAIMGMMAQLTLKDLADKTRRGLLGRILKGAAAGGIAYGYRIKETGDGERGGREIVPAEAEVVRRIFHLFAMGRSPEAIARELNAEGVPGPDGRLWGNTGIRGHVDRGTGLLNNDLYRGLLVWNRCSFVKDPRTGKRVPRPNPPESWERVEVPDLRIVDDALWMQVKARQIAIRHAVRPVQGEEADANVGGPSLNAAHRPRFLLSGLMVCGCCGGGYTVVAKDRYGCATRKQKGTCTNALTISRQEIEGRVLVGLKDRLMASDMVEAFMAAFVEETARVRAETAGKRDAVVRRHREVEGRIASILKAVEDGLYHASMKERLAKLEAEKLMIEAELSAEPVVSPVQLHPNLPQMYRRKVEELEAALEHGPDRDEAREVVRSLIEQVVLTPRAEVEKGLDATLHGALAGILAACEVGKRRLPEAKASGSQLSVVAGAGNLLCLQMAEATVPVIRR